VTVYCCGIGIEIIERLVEVGIIARVVVGVKDSRGEVVARRALDIVIPGGARAKAVQPAFTAVCVCFSNSFQMGQFHLLDSISQKGGAMRRERERERGRNLPFRLARGSAAVVNPTEFLVKHVAQVVNVVKNAGVQTVGKTTAVRTPSAYDYNNFRSYNVNFF
jgi:hypothetical protein